MREAIRKFNRYFFPKRPTALQRNVDDLIKKICNKENNEDLRLQKYDELINLVKNKDVKDFSANNLLFLCIILDDEFTKKALGVLRSEYNDTFAKKQYDKTNAVIGARNFRRLILLLFSEKKAAIHALSFFYHERSFKKEFQDLSDLLQSFIFKKPSALEKVSAERLVGGLLPQHNKFREEYLQLINTIGNNIKNKKKSFSQIISDSSQQGLDGFKNYLKEKKEDNKSYIFNGFMAIAQSLETKLPTEEGVKGKERMQLAILIYLLGNANNTILPKPRREAIFEYENKGDPEISGINPLFKPRAKISETKNNSENMAPTPSSSSDFEKEETSESTSQQILYQSDSSKYLESQSKAGEEKTARALSKGSSISSLSDSEKSLYENSNSENPSIISSSLQSNILPTSEEKNVKQATFDATKKPSRLENAEAQKKQKAERPIDVLVSLRRSMLELSAYFQSNSHKGNLENEKLEFACNNLENLTKTLETNISGEVHQVPNILSNKKEDYRPLLKTNLEKFSQLAGEKIEAKGVTKENLSDTIIKAKSLIDKLRKDLENTRSAPRSTTTRRMTMDNNGNNKVTPVGRLVPNSENSNII